MPAVVQAAFLFTALLIATLVLIASREHHRARTLNELNLKLVAARDEAQRLAMRARRLQAVATALSVAKSPEDVADIVLDLGLGVVEASRGYLAVVEDSGLQIVHARGYTTDALVYVRQLTMADDVPLTRAAKSRAPVYLETVEEYRREYPWAYERFGTESDTQAHAALPLVFDDRVVGALGLSFAASTSFGAADRSFTILLAQVAAAALNRAREFQAERAQRVHAEQLACAREEILAIVAHDLRNPLNLVNTTAQLILEVELGPEKRRQLLDASIRASRQMSRLIGDLLDVARIQSGRLSLEMAQADVRSILQQLEEMFLPQAAKRRITFDTHGPAEDIVIVVDASRTVQALGNLVGNALKFTPERGRVLLAADFDGRRLLFRVEDSGPGIPPEHIARLFDRFWQGQHDRRGIGLGLAIAKGIAEAHGGAIEVSSVVGQGTIFTFALPGAQRGVAATLAS